MSDVSKTNEALIAEARRWANGHPNRRSSELMRALADALAAVPDAATEELETLRDIAETHAFCADRLSIETERADWVAREVCDRGCSYTGGPDEECSAHGRTPRELWEFIAQDIVGRDAATARAEKAEAERDAALAAVERVRATMRTTAAKTTQSPTSTHATCGASTTQPAGIPTRRAGMRTKRTASDAREMMTMTTDNQTNEPTPEQEEAAAKAFEEHLPLTSGVLAGTGTYWCAECSKNIGPINKARRHALSAALVAAAGVTALDGAPEPEREACRASWDCPPSEYHDTSGFFTCALPTGHGGPHVDAKDGVRWWR